MIERDPIPLYPIDVVYASDIVDGDLELLKEIVALFLTEYPTQLTAMQQAIADGRAREAGNEAHRLKGSLGNIGGWLAYKLAYDLEQMGHHADLSGAKECLFALTAEIERIALFFARLDWTTLACQPHLAL